MYLAFTLFLISYNTKIFLLQSKPEYSLCFLLSFTIHSDEKKVQRCRENKPHFAHCQQSELKPKEPLVRECLYLKDKTIVNNFLHSTLIETLGDLFIGVNNRLECHRMIVNSYSIFELVVSMSSQKWQILNLAFSNYFETF